MVLQQSAHPQTSHHQADVAYGDGEDIKSRHHVRMDGQQQHPPVDDEIEHKASAEYCPDSWPGNLLVDDSLRAEAWEGKQEQGKEFGVEDIPLLFRAIFHRICNKIILIEANIT